MVSCTAHGAPSKMAGEDSVLPCSLAPLLSYSSLYPLRRMAPVAVSQRRPAFPLPVTYLWCSSQTVFVTPDVGLESIKNKGRNFQINLKTCPCVSFFFLSLFIYLFIYLFILRKRECACPRIRKEQRERETRGERIPSRPHAVSAEARTPEPQDHDLRGNQESDAYRNEPPRRPCPYGLKKYKSGAPGRLSR